MPEASPTAYLDNNATTPLAPEVREAMLPYLGEHFGNPSGGYAMAREARAAVETARESLAALIGAAIWFSGTVFLTRRLRRRSPAFLIGGIW